MRYLIRGYIEGFCFGVDEFPDWFLPALVTDYKVVQRRLADRSIEIEKLVDKNLKRIAVKGDYVCLVDGHIVGVEARKFHYEKLAIDNEPNQRVFREWFKEVIRKKSYIKNFTIMFKKYENIIYDLWLITNQLEIDGKLEPEELTADDISNLSVTECKIRDIDYKKSNRKSSRIETDSGYSSVSSGIAKVFTELQ